MPRPTSSSGRPERTGPNFVRGAAPYMSPRQRVKIINHPEWGATKPSGIELDDYQAFRDSLTQT
jgi:hypothetical protein